MIIKYPYTKKNRLSKMKFLIIAPILILLIISGCKDSGTDIQPVKDPRNYSWTVDTLEFPNSAQTLMNDLWGSSKKDVYVVGHNSRAYGKMWHYDGETWTDVKLKASRGGNISGVIDLKSISGISGSNIWAVGEKIRTNASPPPNFIDSSLIIYYNGTSWNEVNFERRRRLADVYAKSANNVWAVGDTTIYHYDGVKWTREYVPLVTPPNSSLFISKIVSNDNTVYASGSIHNNLTGEDVNYIFIRNEKGWSILNSSSSRTDFGTTTLWISPSGKLYSAGSGIYTLNGNRWVNIFFNATRFSEIYGTSDTNIFAVGIVGTTSMVYHYNGQDWKKLDELTVNNILYTSVWTEGTEAFISGFTLGSFPQKTIIWHGK